MKKLYKISALALAILAVSFAALQTNAQNAVTLEITGGSISCSHVGWDMGSTGSSLTDVTLGPVVSTGAYTCTDLQGTTNNAMTVTMDVSLTNSIDTIPDANVAIATGVITENCTNNVLSAAGTLDGVISLMTKETATDVCTYSMNPSLSVTVPARFSLGTYNGTLQVVYPV